MTDTAVPPPPAPAASSQNDDKTVALLSYLTLIGFIVAIVLHNNKKTEFGAYHLRQALGLLLVWVGLFIVLRILAIGLLVIPFVGWLLFLLLQLGVWLGLLALVVLGVLAAINGQKKPLPVVGAYFEKWFGTTFD